MRLTQVLATQPSSIKATVRGLFGRRWSDPDTWGPDGYPDSGTDILVGVGENLILDIEGAVANSIIVAGTLSKDAAVPVSLTVGHMTINNGGALRIGTESVPSYTNCTFTFNGAEANRVTRYVDSTQLGAINDRIGRSLQVMNGGRLEVFGTTATIKRSKLNADAAEDANVIELEHDVGTGAGRWMPGDKFVVGPSDYYGTHGCQLMTVASVSGKFVTTVETLDAARFGRLQYVVDVSEDNPLGISFTDDGLTDQPIGTTRVIDERAAVIHLTSNVVFQGANDTAWTSNGIGLHIMVMGLNSVVNFVGGEIRRCGQRGALGAYPFHWHMLSYNQPNGPNLPTDGTYLGPADGHYLRRTSIWDSEQRATVIHGTDGVEVSDCVMYNIKGHANFLEDNVERKNFYLRNTVMRVRAPASIDRLFEHDKAPSAPDWPNDAKVAEGSSGFWIPNPDNTIVENAAYDVQGPGFWFGFAAEDNFGLCEAVSTAPNSLPVLLIQNNEASCNLGTAMMTAMPPVDRRGNLNTLTYNGGSLSRPITGTRGHHNSAGFYKNRIGLQRYEFFVGSSNESGNVFGVVQKPETEIEGFTLVSLTRNAPTPRNISSRSFATASYHELAAYKNMLVVGFRYIAGVQSYSGTSFKGGGVMPSDDFYLRPMTNGTKFTGWKLVNCGMPFKTKSPQIDGATLVINSGSQRRNWAIGQMMSKADAPASNLFVQMGIPPGYALVDDVDFHTYDATSVEQSVEDEDNGVLIPDPFYGFGSFGSNLNPNDEYHFELPIAIIRQNSSGTEVGRWEIGDGSLAPSLGNMRHGVLMKDGRYLLTFPNGTPSTYVYATIDSMYASTDAVVVGFKYSGATIVVRSRPSGVGANDAYARTHTRVYSMAAVLSDTTGYAYYYDEAADEVWMHVMGYAQTSAYPYPDTEQDGEAKIYRPLQVRISTT